MEEINLNELFKYFKEKWLVILIIVLSFGVIGSIYYAFIQVPTYTSNTTLILAGSKSEDTINQNDITINSKLVKTYQKIIRSRRVLDQVISELGLDVTWDSLANNINVNVVSDTEVIEISVTHTDAVLAYRIANSVANVFVKEVAELYNLSNISILDRAVVSDHPSSMGMTKILAIAILAGFVVACGIVFVIFYFDDTIKSVEQIESKLGVSVLGSVPYYNVKTEIQKQSVTRKEKRL